MISYLNTNSSPVYHLSNSPLVKLSEMDQILKNNNPFDSHFLQNVYQIYRSSLESLRADFLRKLESGSSVPTVLNDEGCKLFPNGDFALGELKNDNLHGRGKLLSNDLIAIGNFINGDFVHGTLIYPNQTLFQGNFIKSKLQGPGRIVILKPDLTTIAIDGNFKDNSLIEGEIRYSDGKSAKGLFKNNHMHGLGTLSHQDWTIEGHFKDGSFTLGKMSLSNGEIWEGEFKNDLLHGKGRKTYPNGSQETGIFKNGILEKS